jgi:hypothetical protein
MGGAAVNFNDPFPEPVKLSEVLDDIDDATIAEVNRQHEATNRRAEALREYDYLKWQVVAMEKAGSLILANKESQDAPLHASRCRPIESGLTHEELRSLALDRLNQKLAEQRKLINELVRAEAGK